MNLFDRLMKADAAKADEMETKKVTSKRLAHILGEKEPVSITIRALPSREVQHIQEYITDDKGRTITGRLLDASFMACAKGIVDPDVTNTDFIAHFGARDAKGVVEKVFQMEATDIGAKIMTLSGADTNNGEEIKN